MLRTACALASAIALSACGLSLNGELSDAIGGPSGGGDIGVDAAIDGASGGGAGGSVAGGDASSGEVDAGSDASGGDHGDAAAANDAGSPEDSGSGANDSGTVTRVVKVPATQGPGCGAWFDPGVMLAAGDSLILSASGQWNYGIGPALQCGADGNSLAGSYDGFPTGALLGRIGDGSAFKIGSTYTGTVSAPGALQLGIADGLCGDNSGALDVTISVGP